VAARRGVERATWSLEIPGSGAGEGVRFSTFMTRCRRAQRGNFGREKKGRGTRRVREQARHDVSSVRSDGEGAASMADEGAPGGGSCAEERGEVGHQPSAVTAVGPTAQFSTFPSSEDDTRQPQRTILSPSPIPLLLSLLWGLLGSFSLSILLFKQHIVRILPDCCPVLICLHCA